MRIRYLMTSKTRAVFYSTYWQETAVSKYLWKSGVCWHLLFTNSKNKTWNAAWRNSATTQCLSWVPWSPGGSAAPFCTKHCHPLTSLLALHLWYKWPEPGTSKEVNTFGFLLENESSVDVAPATVEHAKGVLIRFQLTIKSGRLQHCSSHQSEKEELGHTGILPKEKQSHCSPCWTRAATQHEEQWKSRLQGFWWNDSSSTEQSVGDENQPGKHSHTVSIKHSSVARPPSLR